MDPIYIAGSSHPSDRLDHPRSRLPSLSSPVSISARPIPGASRHIEPPPPLPPPRYPMDDPGDRRMDLHRGPSYSSPFSWCKEQSDYGSMDMDDRPNYQRHGSSSTLRPDTDDGYESLPSISQQTSLPLRFAAHDNYRIPDYDRDVVSKLNRARPSRDRSPPRLPSFGSSPSSEPLSRRFDRFPTSLKPLTMPAHSKPPMMLLSSPARYSETPHSATSTHGLPFSFRSPVEIRTHESAPKPEPMDDIPEDVKIDVKLEDAPSSMAEDAEETSQMRRLAINDSADRRDYYGGGLKRRASSPPGDDLGSYPLNGSSLVRRREGAARGSPTPRLATLAKSSVSSHSSAGRSGSYSSTLSIGASSVTSANSYGHLSPGGISPAALSPVATDPACNSPYLATMTLNPSPRGSTSRSAHQRTHSDNRQIGSPRKPETPKAAVTRIPGILMCECCPKKPKKFETQEKLSAHESEKQYECSYCGNRFKNKNEMERHQNSLHVRPHSWSCAALSSYARAFHESTTRQGEADVCGYCGAEYTRHGSSSSSTSSGEGAAAREATEKDWDERIRHLTEVHKFRECNSGKKFYRADHFRQHLKHSHAGTSGKWTNMLETACMIEEELTPTPQ